jgi:peptidoglycan/xylan/chitin deacetylase (PgdA/CDA1 family)
MGDGSDGGVDGVAEGAAGGQQRRDRRGLLRDAGVLALGAGIGTIGLGQLADVADVRRDARAGSAATDVSVRISPPRGRLVLTWEVDTEHPLVALTFDDGPRPEWTNLVLDTLDRYKTPATFFMVGRRVRKYASVVRGRLGRHEVGNHTWDHLDLAFRDDDQARSDLVRAHHAIADVLGREPVLFRPPYGHIGGAAALAAAELGYQVVLWSQKMREAHYNTPLQVAAVLRDTIPGTILLAHDVGARDRLVSLRGLPAMIIGLRARGFEFVTVSELLQRARPLV